MGCYAKTYTYFNVRQRHKTKSYTTCGEWLTFLSRIQLRNVNHKPQLVIGNRFYNQLILIVKYWNFKTKLWNVYLTKENQNSIR